MRDGFVPKNCVTILVVDGEGEGGEEPVMVSFGYQLFFFFACFVTYFRILSRRDRISTCNY